MPPRPRLTRPTAKPKSSRGPWAEALGASYRGRPAGSFGLAGILSFNGNKIITTGGGGMLVTDDGRGAGVAPSSDPGHGLVGMRQRASISGGTVSAGPKAGGGYEVIARLPYHLPTGGEL